MSVAAITEQWPLYVYTEPLPSSSCCIAAYFVVIAEQLVYMPQCFLFILKYVERCVMCLFSNENIKNYIKEHTEKSLKNKTTYFRFGTIPSHYYKLIEIKRRNMTNVVYSLRHISTASETFHPQLIYIKLFHILLTYFHKIHFNRWGDADLRYTFFFSL